jgi:hypothetical protein
MLQFFKTTGINVAAVVGLLLTLLSAAAAHAATPIACPEPPPRVSAWTYYSQTCYDLGVLDELPDGSACSLGSFGVRRTPSVSYVMAICYFRLSQAVNIEAVESSGASGRNGYIYPSHATITGQPPAEATLAAVDHRLFRFVPASVIPVGGSLADAAPHKLVISAALGWTGSGSARYTVSLDALPAE